VLSIDVLQSDEHSCTEYWSLIDDDKTAGKQDASDSGLSHGLQSQLIAN
jgi:hypothetical protein